MKLASLKSSSSDGTLIGFCRNKAVCYSERLW
ncbi:hypothetical protein JOE11_002007 [Robbsia andropogonis]